MTHEPIHTVHLTPHITWQGTQAELEAMQAEGWPTGQCCSKRPCIELNWSASSLAACLRRSERRWLARWLDLSDDELNNLPIGLIIDDHKQNASRRKRCACSTERTDE
jgi:hypothetical protein